LETTFDQGDNSLANKTLLDGKVSFTTHALPIGQDVITANYSGDSNYGFSSATLTERVLAANTTLALTSSPNPSFVGQAVKFVATITSNSGTPADGETITFGNDTRIYATALLKAGTASIDITSIPAGTPTIKATYPDDNTFDASSASLKQVVNRYATSTRVTSNANPSPLGTVVTFTATVTGSGSTTPTGWVTFKDGTTVIGAQLLNAGKAKLTLSSLSKGQHSIVASYHATTTWKSSTSPILIQVVE
jgi:large repetitive protein